MPKIHSVRVTPTITAGIYVDLDALGGLLTFDIGQRPSEGFILQAVLIHDEAAQQADVDLVLFGETFTATPDADSMDVSDADLLKCVGVISVTTWFDLVSGDMAVARDLNLPIKLAGASGNLFGQLVIRGATPTYAATNDISVTVVLEK